MGESVEADEEREPLPLDLLGYVALLEWTGRMVRDDKRGAITGPPSQLVEALGLAPETWLDSVESFGSQGGFVGHPSRLRHGCPRLA